MSKWLKNGDQVVVIAGNERGKTGKVIGVGKKRVVVEGINMRKKTLKPTQERPKGDIIDLEAPLHKSNIAPCDGNGKKVRLRVKSDAKGKKDLVYKDGSKQVVYRTIRKGK